MIMTLASQLQIYFLWGQRLFIIVGAFSVITNLRMVLFQALIVSVLLSMKEVTLHFSSAVAGLTCNDQDRRKWTVRRQRRKCFVDCGGCFCKS